ncbi:MAG TPA: hypothetical protein VGE76_20205, partial [Opitutaceae bacterium]
MKIDEKAPLPRHNRAVTLHLRRGEVCARADLRKCKPANAPREFAIACAGQRRAGAFCFSISCLKISLVARRAKCNHSVTAMPASPSSSSIPAGLPCLPGEVDEFIS